MTGLPRPGRVCPNLCCNMNPETHGPGSWGLGRCLGGWSLHEWDRCSHQGAHRPTEPPRRCATREHGENVPAMDQEESLRRNVTKLAPRAQTSASRTMRNRLVAMSCQAVLACRSGPNGPRSGLCFLYKQLHSDTTHLCRNAAT